MVSFYFNGYIGSTITVFYLSYQRGWYIPLTNFSTEFLACETMQTEEFQILSEQRQQKNAANHTIDCDGYCTANGVIL